MSDRNHIWVLAMICLPLVSFSERLVGWEAFGNSRTNNTTQASTNAWGQLVLNEYGVGFTYTARGSGDDTFGTAPGAAHGTVWLNRSLGLKSTEISRITIVLQNTHPTDYLVLDGLHLDAWRSFDNAPSQLKFSSRAGNISGEVIATEVLTVKGVDAGFNGISDFDDIDVVLTNLADHVLAPGQRAWLDIFVSGGKATDVSTYLDNISITGTFSDHLER